MAHTTVKAIAVADAGEFDQPTEEDAVSFGLLTHFTRRLKEGGGVGGGEVVKQRLMRHGGVRAWQSSQWRDGDRPSCANPSGDRGGCSPPAGP